MSFLLGLDRPFAKAGDPDVITSAEIVLDEIEEALYDVDTVFLGDAELFVSGFDDVNLGQTHDDSPSLAVSPTKNLETTFRNPLQKHFVECQGTGASEEKGNFANLRKIGADQPPFPFLNEFKARGAGPSN